MAALSTSPNNNNNLNLNTIDTNFEIDKLTYEIFYILENKFLSDTPTLKTPRIRKLVRFPSEIEPATQQE
jgi:hypothetical protein